MFTSLPRSTSPTYVEDMDQEAITSADALPESSRMTGASTLDTFVTAPSGASLTSSNRVPSSGFFTPQADQARFDSTVGLVQPVLGSASLSGNTGAEFARSPALESNVATLPESDAPTKMPIKGKGKTARFAEPQEELPVPPGDVLARRGSSIEETSAGAAEEAIAENSVKWGDIIMEGVHWKPYTHVDTANAYLRCQTGCSSGTRLATRIFWECSMKTSVAP
jgi:hypothetical protein